MNQLRMQNWVLIAIFLSFSLLRFIDTIGSTSMIEINGIQRNNIINFINRFKIYSNTQDYESDMKDREERVKFFSTISEEKFLAMNEFEFGEIISKLWASLIWGNKDYHVDRIISTNGFESLKKILSNLLFDEKKVAQNFDDALSNIKFLGPASITELLCYFFPNSCGIWNKKARDALEILGFSKDLPLKKYQINSKDYLRFNDILIQISNELKKSGFVSSDLLFVDYFLYYVQAVPEIIPESICIPKANTEKSFDHNEVRDFISYIGEFLGFKTEIEKPIAAGARVDVIWEAQIANLGVVNYVFEVHKNGAIDSLILNLQKSKHSQTVQKVIAVSDSEQLERIKREITNLPDEFIRSMAFWEVSDVENTYKKLSEVFVSINKLELVKSDFGKINNMSKN